MAPLPPNNTMVLFCDYTSGEQRHSAEVRLPVGTSLIQASAAYAAIAAACAPFLYTTDTFIGARVRQAGSNLSFPLSVAPVAGTLGGPADPDRRPTFLSLTGRSAGGRRGRFTLYTGVIDTDADGFRNNTPNAATNALRTALASDPINACAIDGQKILWNPYVNYGYNAYFQRKIRRSG